MKKNNNGILKITNVFNTENKSEQELKELFNKKYLKTILKIEKNELYDYNFDKKNDTIRLVENAKYFIG